MGQVIMFDALSSLFDTDGFPARKNCGTGWTTELKWLHITSDLFIWLAYVTIPIVLIYFTRRRGLPFARIFYLFALFILACGTTHFLDALMFEYPIYRFAGVMKFITAVVSWMTVIALVPLVPRIMNTVHSASQPGADTKYHSPLPSKKSWRLHNYALAVVAAIVAILVRAAIDPVMNTDHTFVLALLAVVYVSWQGGYGPGILCLILSASGYCYFFLTPRYSFVVESFGTQLALALFFFCGVVCAALGESQRVADRRVRRALVTAMTRQEELEAEVARRKVIESSLLESKAELLRANNESAQSLARLNAFLDNAPLGISFLDPELRYERVNPYLAAATGLPVEEHIGRSLPEVIPDLPQDVLDEYRRIATADGRPHTTQIRRRTADREGAERTWQVTAFPIRGEGGQAFGAGVVVQDITDRLKVEDDLRRSEAKFRRLAEAEPNMVWITDESGHPEYFNRRWHEYTGLDTAASMGWGASELLHPDDKPRVIAQWDQSKADSGDFNSEFRLRGIDGCYRWFLGLAVAERDPDGRVVRWVGTYTDIDDQKRHAELLELTVKKRTADLVEEIEERKQAEAEVRKHQNFLDVILSNISEGIVACDEGGALTLFNRAALEFHNLPMEPLQAEDWTQHYGLFRADGTTPFPTDEIPLFRALRGERVRDAEMMILPTGGGTARFLLASGQPLSDSEGGNLGAVISMRDITEQRAADQQIRTSAAELREANGELRRSNEELEKFAYIASHDLQEPLRKIQAFGDRLRDRYREQLPEQGQDYIDRMLSASVRMRRLIDDLLAFSRVTSQQRPFQHVEMNQLVREVVTDLDLAIAHAGGTVKLGTLPVLDADPTQMRQLFQNLIANAVKFRKPGVPPVVEIAGELLVSTIANDAIPMCRFTVRDNGIGFDEKYADRIFEMFQRLYGRDEYEGTGIGLAICRKIVERHGGTITVRSREGEGSTFEITLPRKHTRAQEPR